MFCSNCGKEISDTVKYCPYCGNKTMSTVSQNYEPVSVHQDKKTTFAGMDMITLVAVVLLIVLNLVFLKAMISGYRGNMDAFDWTSESAQLMGIFLHFDIPFTVIALSVKMVRGFIMKEKNGLTVIIYSIILLAYEIILKIFGWVFNDWSYNDMSIVLYRVFGTYSHSTNVALVITIIVIAVGFLFVKRNSMGNNNLNY